MYSVSVCLPRRDPRDKRERTSTDPDCRSCRVRLRTSRHRRSSSHFSSFMATFVSAVNSCTGQLFAFQSVVEKTSS